MSNWSEASFHDKDVDAMVLWLSKEKLHDCVGPFSAKKINGPSFLNLSEYDIKTFQISQESKRKLTKVLKRMKGRRRNVHRSSENEPTEIREPKRPSAIPAHVNHHSHLDDGEIEGWGSDFDSEDEDDHEGDESGSDSGGEYIEPDSEDQVCAPESPTKEVPNVPVGIVAQLRAGLSGSFRQNPFNGPPAGHSHTQSSQVEEEEEDNIYDEPPDGEEEFYEQPSDDSGSGVVVRPMSKTKVIRCPSDGPGEYIDARAPKYCDKEDPVPCPPPPSRPPKPGAKVIKPPPPMPQPVQPIEQQEVYEEVPENEQPGCSVVVDEYEPWESSGPAHQDTYEIPGQDTYEVPEQEQQQETYEIPEQEQAPPARPPPRGSCWPPKRSSLPDEKKAPPPKEPVKQKPAKPALASKPQVSPKPSPPNPAPSGPAVKRSSRLYPNPSNTGPIQPPSSPRLSSGVFPPPASRQVISPPPPQITPVRKEENNNEKKIINEIPTTSPSPRLPPPRRQSAAFPVDESPPPPPRPGPKPGGPSISRPSPAKPPRLSEPVTLVGEPVAPLSPPRKSPLPPLPTHLKSPVDQLKSSPWFLGPLDKKIAETALKSFSKEGAFIVRNSSKDLNSYSMSLFFKGSVRHLRIPQVNNKYVLGDSGKVQFSTIVELVDYYSQHHVDLKSGGSTQLTAACPVRQ